MSTTPPSPVSSPVTRPLWVIAIALVLIAAFLGLMLIRRSQQENQARAEAALALRSDLRTETAKREAPAEFQSRLSAIAAKANGPIGAKTSDNRQNQAGAGRESLTAQAAAVAAVPGPPAVAANDALLPGAAIANVAGEVLGKVTLVGTPPPEIVIDMSADQRCAAAHPTPVTTRHYVVAPDGGLANVLVYVKKGLEGRTFPTPTDVQVLDQVGCEFQPYVIAVQVNQKLLIKNSDPTLHNLHFTPRINPEFNLAEPIQGQVLERSFSQPEILIRIKCDVHPWMFAYVSVVAHPFFAVTGKDGTFRFPPGLPSGQYTIAAVHGKAGETTQEVAVPEGRPTRVEFTLQVPP